MSNRFRFFGLAAIIAIIGFGCDNSTTTRLPVDLPGAVTISPTGEVTVGTQLTASYSGTEAVTFRWHRDGAPIAGAAGAGATHTPTQAGSFTVTASATGFNSRTSEPVTVVEITGEGILWTAAATPAGGPTTAIELTFDEPVAGLLATDISIAPAGRVTTGALTGGPTLWTLAVTGVVEPGTVSVSIDRDGVWEGPRQVAILGEPQNGTTPDLPGTVAISPTGEVTVGTQLTASYSGTEAVTFRWNRDGTPIEGAAGAGATHTPTQAGSFTVTASALGFNPRTSAAVTVIEGSGIIWTAAAAPGNPTTEIEFTFNEPGVAVGGLVLGNISLYPAGIVNPWQLTRNSATSWTLRVTMLTPGEVSISINRDGIWEGPRQVTILDELRQLDFHFSATLDGYEVAGRGNVIGPIIVIPETHNGQPVRGIAGGIAQFPGAFGSNALPAAGLEVTSVTIPDSVTYIGERAFLNQRLETLIIPDSVTFIGRLAFDGNLLESVTIGSGIETIEAWAFGRNPNFTCLTIGMVHIAEQHSMHGPFSFDSGNLTSLVILDSVETIGENVFRGNQLESLTIGSSVTAIGDGAFDGNRLESVVIPDSVETIGNWAFRGNNLKSLTIGNGVTHIGHLAFQDNRLESVTIPDGVTYIEGDAFRNNLLESITIPDSVTYIGHSAFRNNRLERVTIGSGVTTIGFYAFDDSPYLTHVTVGMPYMENWFSFMGLTSVTILDGVRTVAGFSGNQITSVIIPDSVTNIESWAFGNNRLEALTLPDNVETIGANAFRDNLLEGSVTIPDSVRNIGANAFRNNRLDTLTLPYTVEEVGGNAFADNLLESVYILGQYTEFDGTVGAFGGNPTMTRITVPFRDWAHAVETGALWNIGLPSGIQRIFALEP